jgi:hypothetical protein
MLHYFNSGHESAVLNASPNYTLPARPAKMMRDLSFLPAWYASEDDLVWVEKGIAEDYVLSLEMRFGKMPAAVNEENIGQYRARLMNEKVSLWGLSPSAIRFFEEINRKYRLNLQLPVWSDAYRTLCSRRTAKDCLEYLISRIPEIRTDIVPQYFTEAEAVKQALKDRPGNCLVKSPYSSSGRGLLWLSGENVDRASMQVLKGMLDRQGCVSMEKALDRVEDFSMQFHSDGKGNILFEGLSLFYTDGRGCYRGSLVASQRQIMQTLEKYHACIAQADRIRDELIAYLSGKFASVYEGHIGVDMMICRENSDFYLHPCVEINARTTMGYLALQLQKRLFRNGGSGRFQIIHSDVPGALMHKVESCGCISLCPVDGETHYSGIISM